MVIVTFDRKTRRIVSEEHHPHPDDRPLEELGEILADMIMRGGESGGDDTR